MSDIVLVAPRPLRVISLSASQRQPLLPTSRIMSPPVDAFSRVRLAEGGQPPEDDASSPSGRGSASPRLNLSSDALEEFLSILRPSLFTSSSPTFRTRRHEQSSTLMVSMERPQAFRPRDGSHSRSPSIGSAAVSDNSGAMSGLGRSSPAIDSRLCGEYDQNIGSAWRVPGILESPVSRTHTRNPFQRHPSYEMAFSNAFVTHLSPSLLPLPQSPSPVPLSLSPSVVQFLPDSGDVNA
ncbi:hypothetical protein M0805_006025 [Coniferiporia weirii]|nr:hypothetical protein M0805_006025 [Coniferiporia weirii]